MPATSNPTRARWWLLLRRPLLLALFIGSGVSLMSSGRLTPRLVVDGAVSFAFVPVFELAAFALVHRRGSPRVPSPPGVPRLVPLHTAVAGCLSLPPVLVCAHAAGRVGR